MNLTVTPRYSWRNNEQISATKLNLTGYPVVSLNAIDDVPIGATTPSTGAFTELTADSIDSPTITSLRSDTDFNTEQMIALAESLAEQDIELPEELEDFI